jgi:hypothetical protein
MVAASCGRRAVADLPPTQYLIMEVLAARARTGETLWTFPSNLAVPLRALEDLGLLSVMHGITSGSLRAQLTDAGREHSLKAGYFPPNGGLFADVAADVRTVLDQRQMHSHRVTGVWDSTGLRCAECAARRRLWNALEAVTR